MRIVVANRLSRRGEGLGNEAISWAKGWIASRALDAHLVGPAWGLNRRGYYRNFGSSRLDFILEDCLSRLPHHTFSETDYLATGEIDFATAIEKWALGCELSRKRSFVVCVGGMWGGYRAIRNARIFLLGKLINSRDALRNFYEIRSKVDRDKILVAVHMRTATGPREFRSLTDNEDARGRFNIVVPPEWYLSVCNAIKQQFGDRVQFWFFTDHGGPGFNEAVRKFNPGQPVQAGSTECSDLLLMSQADLRVCSISSYSLTACFLAEGPYLWYEPQLGLKDGIYSLWGHELAQQADDSPTGQSSRYVSDLLTDSVANGDLPVDFLGYAIKIGQKLPDPIVRLLVQRSRTRDPRTNLIEFGCVPQFAGNL